MQTPSDLRALSREIPDFPKPGILFYDVTPMLGNGPAFRSCIRLLCERVAAHRPQIIAGVESRGFIFGANVAMELGVGFVPIRKPGKLPCKTRRECYSLEYGTDAVEVHEDAVKPGMRVALVDDLLATGGTAGAAIRLLDSLGGKVVVAGFVIELAALGGRKCLGSVPTEVLISYP